MSARLHLFGLYLFVKGREWVEGIKVLLFYYLFHWRFARADLSLLVRYLFRNPYKVCARFLEERGAADPYTYGETPLTTMDLIATAFGITRADILFELGCGRGRSCLWLRYFVGCEVVGIEQVGEFVEKAKAVCESCGISGVTFIEGDFLSCDLSSATFLYLYASAMEEAEIERLLQLVRQLPVGVRIASVSFPLGDYAEPGLLRLCKKIRLPFFWGKADIYLEEIVLQTDPRSTQK